MMVLVGWMNGLKIYDHSLPDYFIVTTTTTLMKLLVIKVL